MTIQFAIASRRAGAKYQIAVPYGEFRPRDISLMGGRDAITENDIEFSTLPPLSAADRFPPSGRSWPTWTPSRGPATSTPRPT